jgi:hypothetical protein
MVSTWILRWIHNGILLESIKEFLYGFVDGILSDTSYESK